MINLLPKDAQRTVVWEYRARILTLWALLVGAVLFLVGILMVPTYVYLELQLDVLNAQSIEAGRDIESIEAVEDTVREANRLARELTKPPQPILASTVLGALEEARNGDITISSYRVALTEEREIREAILRGSAASRDALARFKNDIEADPIFARALVPISDLAQESNLPFAITVTISDSALTRSTSQ